MSQNFYFLVGSMVPARAWIVRLAQEAKGFWFFSSEKNILVSQRKQIIQYDQ
jgi:hypothetical protein